VRFWGTRGIVPSPRLSTSLFGGNTNCIEILHKGSEIIVVDTGYGIALLGESLQDRILNHKETMTVHIFFTHFHWDHVLGLPFFHPIYFPSTQIHLYAPYEERVMMKSLDVLFDGSYSPFSGIGSMPSKIRFHHLKRAVSIEGVKVDFTQVNHDIQGLSTKQLLTYGYKFSSSQQSIVVASDHEVDKDNALNKQFVKFAKRTNILIHDGQYTDKDVVRGWGHSTITQALDNACRIQPGITILTHHHPDRNDDEILALHAHFKSKKEYKNLKFEFAREGAIFDSSLFNSTDKK
jgi:phosphoribosyl 1,2-cyclic phosphodiesterase